jgi:hypothetical protein
MSGPGLRSIDSHAAIHEAAINEAKELNQILKKLLLKNEKEKALEVAYIAVEHWETRTLRHAESEEQGLYKEIVKEEPELKDSVLQLTRDHDTLRWLVQEIKALLDAEGMSDEVLERLYALVYVDLYHNETEERVLPDH